MIKSKIILFLTVLMLCTSCNAQHIQVVVNDNRVDEIKVLSLLKKDTITLTQSKPSFYTLKNGFSQAIFIVYKQKMFKISNLDEESKSIFVDYDEKADNKCYVVNKVYGDAAQSSGIENLKKCKSITNVYIYNHYNPNRDNKPSVKFRIKN